MGPGGPRGLQNRWWALLEAAMVGSTPIHPRLFIRGLLFYRWLHKEGNGPNTKDMFPKHGISLLCK